MDMKKKQEEAVQEIEQLDDGNNNPLSKYTYGQIADELIRRQGPVLKDPAQPPMQSAPKQMYPIICDDCGKKSEVPFPPRPGWKKRCPECFARHRNNQSHRGW